VSPQGKDIICWTGETVCDPSLGVNPDYLERADTQYVCSLYEHFCTRTSRGWTNNSFRWCVCSDSRCLWCVPVECGHDADGSPKVSWMGHNCPASLPCPPHRMTPLSFFDADVRHAEAKAIEEAAAQEAAKFQQILQVRFVLRQGAVFA
jgi:hypothetical protein